MVEWCKQAALENNLKDCDYWGGFVIDEMKIEVRNRIGRNTAKNLQVKTYCFQVRLNRFLHKW